MEGPGLHKRRMRTGVGGLSPAWDHQNTSRLNPLHRPSKNPRRRGDSLSDHPIGRAGRQHLHPTESWVEISQPQFSPDGALEMMPTLSALHQDHGGVRIRNRKGNSGETRTRAKVDQRPPTPHANLALDGLLQCESTDHQVLDCPGHGTVTRQIGGLPPIDQHPGQRYELELSILGEHQAEAIERSGKHLQRLRGPRVPRIIPVVG